MTPENKEYFLENAPKVAEIINEIDLFDFDQWLNQNLHWDNGKGGIRHGTMYPLRDRLIEIYDELEKDNVPDIGLAEITDIKRKLAKWYPAINAYRKSTLNNQIGYSDNIEIKLRAPKNTDSSSESIEPETDKEIEKAKEKTTPQKKQLKKKRATPAFKEKQKVAKKLHSLGKFKEWYVYFFHMKHREKAPEPMIARTVLRAYDNKYAELDNLLDTHYKDYVGEFDKIHSSHVFYFDLWNDLESRGLHFKCRFPENDDEQLYLFGSYTTYDNSAIYSGSLIFERITDDKRNKEEIKPLTLHYQNNPADFDKIDPSIIEYLAIKSRNYYFVPRETFGSKLELETFVNGYSPFKKTEQRFFDAKKARLFIAYPQTSLKVPNSEVESQNELMESLAEDIETIHEDVKVLFSSQKSENMTSFMNLMDLRRTKYFVLILGEVKQASFSLVQLGWAMAYCKHILVFYKQRFVSERFLVVTNIGICKVKYENDLETDYKKIKDSIINFVKDPIKFKENQPVT